MIVKTTKEYEGMPTGSAVYVESEDDEFYFGKWSFNCCTVGVGVPKTICEVIEE